MSAGGLASLALTDIAPDLVRKAVLVDVTPGVTREKAKRIGDFVNGPPSFANFDELLERTVRFNPTRSVSSLRRGILHNAVQQDDGTWVWRWARWPMRDLDDSASPESPRRQAPDAPIYRELWDSVGAMKVPLMLARGMRADSVVNDDDEAELLRRKPDAHIVHFEQAGHSIQGDMPVELAREIAAFLDE
jgi:pimeloyl-ACP methyl ester carboxylesterase